MGKKRWTGYEKCVKTKVRVGEERKDAKNVNRKKFLVTLQGSLK